MWSHVCCQVYKAELERLQSVLEKSGSEQKRALTDTSRRLVLLRVHERTLRRELQLAQERGAADHREIRRLQVIWYSFMFVLIFIQDAGAGYQCR